MSEAVSRTKARATVLRLIASGLFACVACTGIVLAAEGAKPAASIPDFSSNGVGWIAANNDFLPPVSGQGPVTSDPAHPYIQNGEGKQPTFRVADLNNPSLMPWVKAELKKFNDDVLAGKTHYTRANSCWPAGVPTILLIRIQPFYFVQTPKEIWMMWQNDHQVRRIYMNQPHTKNPKPSWYGESVGHYEGDTLVVDTIGVTTQTAVDNYSTPHSDKLHVVERFHMMDGGKNMQVDVKVEDPGAFTTPWSAIQRYRRVQQGPILEEACAETTVHYLNDGIGPPPQTDKPDF